MKLKTLISLIVLPIALFGQHKVLVVFKDKSENGFNPYNYFDKQAIERRLQLGLPLYDYTDLPVNQNYVQQIAQNVQQVTATTRWFNGVVCIASDMQLNQLHKLSFVENIETLTPLSKMVCGSIKGVDDLNDSDKEILKAQTARMQADVFKANNINGKGVRVAIFDIGFESYKTNPAFEHMRKNNRIVKTWDFVKKAENVDGYNTHGTSVLSCVGGIADGVNIGLATDAEFLLARTETWTEFYSEEEHWLQAAEWADKNGAHIINSSLGYTFHRYFPEQMDGHKSLVSRAANMAARKGILVVNSAGNEGDGDWKIIGTPADADSVLSIGGISPWTGYHTGFSSFGPTSDKRLKPNVIAYGHVIGAGPKGLHQTQGTSFSGPLTAGFAACAKQAMPGLTNMQLFKEIEKSADMYPYFDYAHGYGVPQASYFFKKNIISNPPEKLIEFEDANGKITIKVLDVEQYTPDEGEEMPEDTIVESEDIEDVIEAAIDDNESIVEESPESEVFTRVPDYVFFHIENAKGYLDKYWVVDPQPNYNYIFGNLMKKDSEKNELDASPLVINKVDYAKPFTLRVFYKGQTYTHLVK